MKVRPASAKLMKELGSIASQLQIATSDDRKIVSRKVSGGEIRKAVETYKPTTALVYRVKVRQLWELGNLLEHIADGVPAENLFPRSKTKPKRDDMHQRVALAYWGLRAINPSGDRRIAIQYVRRTVRGAKKLEDSTILTYAKKHRELALAQLSIPYGAILQFKTGECITAVGQRRIAALREYLRKKGQRRP